VQVTAFDDTTGRFGYNRIQTLNLPSQLGVLLQQKLESNLIRPRGATVATLDAVAATTVVAVFSRQRLNADTFLRHSPAQFTLTSFGKNLLALLVPGTCHTNSAYWYVKLISTSELSNHWSH
jgi:hypothetical protein